VARGTLPILPMTIQWPYHLRSFVDLKALGLSSTVFRCSLPTYDGTFSFFKLSSNPHRIDKIPISYYQALLHLCIETATLQAFHLENRLIPDPAEEDDAESIVQWLLGYRQTLAYHFSVSTISKMPQRLVMPAMCLGVGQYF
jgi:hypothetical protein